MSLCMFISTMYVLHCISKPTFQVEFQLADLEEVTVREVWQMLSEQTLVWPQNACLLSALRDGIHHTSDMESLNPEFIFRIQNLLEHLFHASLDSTVYTLNVQIGLLGYHLQG